MTCILPIHAYPLENLQVDMGYAKPKVKQLSVALSLIQGLLIE